MNSILKRSAPSEQEFAAAVTLAYLRTGKQQSLADLFKRNPLWSPSGTRRMLRDHGGSVPGIAVGFDYRETYSRDYPGMQSGVARLSVYAPTLWRLRELLLETTEFAYIKKESPQ